MPRYSLSALLAAIHERKLEKVETILKKFPHFLLQSDEYGKTPFHVSSEIAINMASKPSDLEFLEHCIQVSLEKDYNLRKLLNKQELSVLNMQEINRQGRSVLNKQERSGFTALHVVCLL